MAYSFSFHSFIACMWKQLEASIRVCNVVIISEE